MRRRATDAPGRPWAASSAASGATSPRRSAATAAASSAPPCTPPAPPAPATPPPRPTATPRPPTPPPRSSPPSSSSGIRPMTEQLVMFDPNVTAYEAPAIPEGGRNTVVERGGAGDEQGASEFVLDETVHPDGGSCVAQLDAGVGFQFGVGVEMQLQSLPLLLAALLCRSGEGFPAVQTRYHGSGWGHSLHALGTLSLTSTSTTSPPSAGSSSPLQLGRS